VTTALSEASPDAELVVRARSGDADAIEALIEAYRPRLYRYVSAYAGDADDAEDIVQEVLLRLCKHLPRLRDAACFSSWLFRIARNCAHAFYQQRPRLEIVGAGSADAGVVEPAAGEHVAPEQQVLAHEERERIWQALGRLSDRDRQMLALRQADGFSHAEIARVLGISRNAAEVRLNRARARLARLLAEDRTEHSSCLGAAMLLGRERDDDGNLASALSGQRERCEGCREREAATSRGAWLSRRIA
jgi:RNA polymerase sigma-70 factor (ECF subfamily)